MQPSPESLFTRYRTTAQPEPLGELFDLVGPRLLALAMHLCGHPADAEDAVQATFVAAIDQRMKWQAGRPLLPWLSGILDRQCRRIGQRRHRRRERELPDEPLLLDDGTPLQASERRDLVARVRTHVDRLPVEQRQALLLQLEHGLATAEVAEVLGVPPGTVRMRLHRAVQALRGVLPAGFVALLLAALPSRGVAAVRACVLGQAATATAVGGGVVTKHLTVAALVLLGLFGIAMVVPEFLASPADSGAARATEPAFAGADAARPPGREGSADASAARESAGFAAADGATSPAPAIGTLIVRAHHALTRRPVPALPLRVWPDGGDVDTRIAETAAATDDAGVARFTTMAPGGVRVSAPIDGAWTATVTAGATTELAIEVPATVVPRRATGVVRHADGRIAAGATIVAGPSYQDFAVPVAVADAAGAFAVELAFEMPAIGARLAGAAPSLLRLLGAADAPIELVLPGAEARVSGCVVRADGTPVPGAWLEIGASRRKGTWSDAGGAMMSRSPGRSRQAGADGRFAVDGLPAGDVELLVRADGFAAFHRYVTLAAGTCTELRCELTDGFVVSGRVIDTAGAPVADARVVLGGSYGEHQRTTDAEGRFGFRHARPGPQQLRVEGEDVEPVFVERGAAAVESWEVVVTRLPRYRLRCVDERGLPLAGWSISLRADTLREGDLDADGRIVLAVAGAGPFVLRIGAPGTNPTVEVPWPAAVTDTETTVVVPDAARPTAVLAGEIVDAAGQPWPGGWVSLRSGDGVLVREEPTVGAGFRLTELPHGDWSLLVQCAQGSAVLLRVPVPGLRSGEQRRLATLRLPVLGTVRVTVVPLPGRSVDRTGVFLRDTGGGETHIPLGGGGALAVPAGRYRWSVLDDDALWQRGELVVVAGQETTLDVVLQPGVRRPVVFPVPTPAWGAPRYVDFVLRAPDGSVYEDGRFDPREELPYRFVPTVSVGAWQLELTADDGRRFTGSFQVDSMSPSRAPFEVSVAPVR